MGRENSICDVANSLSGFGVGMGMGMGTWLTQLDKSI